MCVSQHSLPELGYRGGKVGDVGGEPQGLVSADRVLHAEFRVPGLLALGPGELRLEALEQVVEPPGQDHHVVHVQQGHDHHGGVADTCRAAEGRIMSSSICVSGHLMNVNPSNQSPEALILVSAKDNSVW